MLYRKLILGLFLLFLSINVFADLFSTQSDQELTLIITYDDDDVEETPPHTKRFDIPTSPVPQSSSLDMKSKYIGFIHYKKIIVRDGDDKEICAANLDQTAADIDRKITLVIANNTCRWDIQICQNCSPRINKPKV